MVEKNVEALVVKPGVVSPVAAHLTLGEETSVQAHDVELSDGEFSSCSAYK